MRNEPLHSVPTGERQGGIRHEMGSAANIDSVIATPEEGIGDLRHSAV
jgi:hypothetical protein